MPTCQQRRGVGCLGTYGGRWAPGAAKSIILNTKRLVSDTQFLVFYTKFIVFTHRWRGLGLHRRQAAEVERRSVDTRIS